AGVFGHLCRPVQRDQCAPAVGRGRTERQRSRRAVNSSTSGRAGLITIGGGLNGPSPGFEEGAAALDAPAERSESHVSFATFPPRLLGLQTLVSIATQTKLMSGWLSNLLGRDGPVLYNRDDTKAECRPLSPAGWSSDA